MTEWNAKSDGDFIVKYQTRPSFRRSFVVAA